jgi:hypothetical protein
MIRIGLKIRTGIDNWALKLGLISSGWAAKLVKLSTEPNFAAQKSKSIQESTENLEHIPLNGPGGPNNRQ